MRRKFAFCAGGAVILLATSALAHHPSGVSSTGGAGPINTITATTLDQGQSSASIMFEMIKFNPPERHLPSQRRACPRPIVDPRSGYFIWIRPHKGSDDQRAATGRHRY
jgi:hypothetical protein